LICVEIRSIRKTQQVISTRHRNVGRMTNLLKLIDIRAKEKDEPKEREREKVLRPSRTYLRTPGRDAIIATDLDTSVPSVRQNRYVHPF
jgi:hypothetical protein